MKCFLLVLALFPLGHSRRSQSEILNPALYRERIRQDYYNVSADAATTRPAIDSLISFKNKIPRYDFQLASVPNTFQPEDAGYIEGLAYLNFVVFYVAALVLLAFLTFVVCRFGCKKCGGTVTNYAYQPRAGKWFFIS